jgi:hypothetical protein
VSAENPPDVADFGISVVSFGVCSATVPSVGVSVIFSFSGGFSRLEGSTGLLPASNGFG